MGKSYKSKKRKIYHTYESLSLMKEKRARQNMQKSLDNIGYRSPNEYREEGEVDGWSGEPISSLAW